MKKCPFCAEEIQDEAIKCKHCGSILNFDESEKSKFSENKKENDLQDKVSGLPQYIQRRIKRQNSLLKDLEKMTKEDFIAMVDNAIRKERIFLLYFLGFIFSCIGMSIGNIFGFILTFSFIYAIWLHPRKGEKILINRIKNYKNYKLRLFLSVIFSFFFLMLWLGGGYSQTILKEEIANTPTPIIEILNKDFSGKNTNNYKTNNTNTGFLLEFNVLNADYITLNSEVILFNTGGIYQKNIELIRPITNVNIFVKNKHKEASYSFNIERNMTDEEKKKEEELKKKEEADRIQREKDEEKRKYEERIAKNWYYNEYKDEMTGHTNKTATAEAENTLYFDFPYQGGSASYLTIRNRRGVLDIMLKVTPSQISGDYNYPTIKAKFDDGKAINYSYSEPADYSSDAIFINSEYDFLNKLKKAKKLLLEVGFYQNGTQTIEFDVEGLKW